MGEHIVICADIGGSHIHSAAIDLATATILDESSNYVEVDRHGSVDEIMTTWAKSLNAAMEGLDAAQIKGVAFAMPGPFNYKTGVALFDGNDKYGALKDLEVEPLIAKNLKYDLPMRFVNDATAFAVGESWVGEGAEEDRVIAITLGTGFGSAFIKNGLPITTGPEVPEHGCLWHLKFLDGIGDEFFSTRWFVKNFQKRTGNEIMGVKDLVALVEEQSKAKGLFVEFGDNLASFMEPWFRKFRPGIFIIGGNISRAYHLFGPSFNRTLAKHSIQLKSTTSKLGEQAALIGSARLFEEEFWMKIKDELPVI